MYCLNFAQKWHVIDKKTESKNKYNQNGSIKFETRTIKSSLYDYSDAYILVTGYITVNIGNNTDIGFKNCALFSACKTEISDVFVDKADHI